MEKINAQEYFKRLFENNVTDLNNPSCANCNECCSITAILLDEEYKQIKKYLSKDKTGRKIYKEAINRVHRYMKNGDIYLMCPFSANKRCTIYNIRPKICRDFHCKKELNVENDIDRCSTERHYVISDLFGVDKKGFETFRKGN